MRIIRSKRNDEIIRLAIYPAFAAINAATLSLCLRSKSGIVLMPRFSA
jgi:hypothetical protein